MRRRRWPRRRRGCGGGGARKTAYHKFRRTQGLGAECGSAQGGKPGSESRGTQSDLAAHEPCVDEIEDVLCGDPVNMVEVGVWVAHEPAVEEVEDVLGGKMEVVV